MRPGQLIAGRYRLGEQLDEPPARLCAWATGLAGPAAARLLRISS